MAYKMELWSLPEQFKDRNRKGSVHAPAQMEMGVRFNGCMTELWRNESLIMNSHCRKETEMSVRYTG